MKTLTEAEVNAMFEHYVERKMYNQTQPSDSQDGLYSAGECREAERWLSLFGIDTSYERIHAIIAERKAVGR